GIAAMKFSAQHQGVLLVMAFDFMGCRLWSQLPETVFVGTEQTSEAGGGIKTGRAEPVDAAIAADQRCAAQIANQCIILDGLSHRRLPPGCFRVFSGISPGPVATMTAALPLSLHHDAWSSR